jgi:hypothetical protein
MPDIDQYWQGRDWPVVVSAVAPFHYRQKPLAEMRALAVESARTWAVSGATLPAALFPDFGTITTAKPWGGRIEVTADGRPFIHPVARTLDQVLDLEPLPENPDLEPAVTLYEHVRAATGIRDLGFRTPDMQGVLNTAALILDQEELLTAMLTDGTRLHRFLDRVYASNLRFARALLQRAGRLDGNLWPYLWMPHRHGLMVIEDYMPLLSPAVFAEFGLPYLKRFADAFGGVFFHCCGEWGRHAKALAESGIRLRGVEYHYPFTRLEELQEHFAGIVINPVWTSFRKRDFGTRLDYFRHVAGQLRNGNRLWLTCTTADADWPAIRAWADAEGFCTEPFNDPVASADDPFYALGEMAAPEGRPMTNADMDDAIYAARNVR